MRKTFLNINIKNIAKNIKKIKNEYNKYEYYIAVVKANAYGLGANKIIKYIIDSGCNYLAVATLEEAIEIRKQYGKIPILCLGLIFKNDLEKAIKNNITITISSKEQLNDILNKDCKNLKVHIKLNTGMNRLGIKLPKDLKYIEKTLLENNINIEGIYSHIYESSNKNIYNKQLNNFIKLLKNINYKNIKIIHLAASDSIINYKKPELINGCRLGLIMYGFHKDLLSTISLKSEIIQINVLNKGEVLGYDGIFKAEKDNVKIAVLPIGYADGINRKIINNYVYINEKPYKIVGNICMDMLFILIDDNVKLHDEVYIYKDTDHIKQISKNINTIPYEIICNISNRVKRVYIK